MIKYFDVLISDLDDNIVDRAIQTSLGTARKSIDGLYCMLKFRLNNVPVGLIQLGYRSKTKNEIKVILKSNKYIIETETITT